MRLLSVLAASMLLAACRDPAPTPTPDPPEPQTTAATEEHTELRDAMQAPLDKAAAVEDTLQESARRRDEQLEDSD